MTGTKTQDNPFNPGFGRIPPLFLDREELTGNIAAGLDNINSPYRTTLISGVRGCGKTVLMADVCSAFASRRGWIVVNLSTGPNLMRTLISTLYDRAQPAIQKLFKSITGMKVSALGLQLEYDNKSPGPVSYQVILENMLRKLKQKKISLLVAIDEVSATESVKEFSSIYQIMLRENLDIALIMTGLPKNISELQNDEVLTFLLRSERIDLEPLSLYSIKQKYRDAFENGGRSISEDATNRLTILSAGYAYAFQLLGFLIWETGADTIDIPLIESIIPEFKTRLYRNVYTKIYEDMSPIDRQFVRAMAHSDLQDIPMRTICESLGKTNSYISAYRKRLLDSQVITSAEYGTVRFSLPFFKDFVIERETLYG